MPCSVRISVVAAALIHPVLITCAKLLLFMALSKVQRSVSAASSVAAPGPKAATTQYLTQPHINHLLGDKMSRYILVILIFVITLPAFPASQDSLSLRVNELSVKVDTLADANGRLDERLHDLQIVREQRKSCLMSRIGISIRLSQRFRSSWQ
jgi:hypothetical protein